MFQVTKEWLEVFRTDRGGYTMDQVRCLGYANGFKTKNWKKKAVGLWISEEAKNMEVKIKRYKSGKNNGSIRKNEVKLDSYDSWCIPWTISHILAPLLTQLKENKNSFGCVSKEDAPEELHNTYDENGYSEQAYDWLLDELIWMFTATSKDFEDEPHFVVGDAWDGESDLGGHIGALKIDEVKKAEYDAYHQRVDNAWRLFGAYGRTLWD